MILKISKHHIYADLKNIYHLKNLQIQNIYEEIECVRQKSKATGR